MWIFARDHPGFVLTFLAITISGVGIYHEVMLLLEFGLNYFEYADPSDFLVAAGKTLVLIATNAELKGPTIIIILMPFFMWLQVYAIRKGLIKEETEKEEKERKEDKEEKQRKKPSKFEQWYKSLFIHRFGLIVAIISAASYWELLNVAADTALNSAERIKEGKADKLLIELRRPERTTPGKWSVQSLHAITSTNQYLFYYERNKAGINDREPPNETVYVVPTDNLAQQVLVERYVSQP